MASKADELWLPKLRFPLRAVPERRPRSRQRRGIELIINAEHRDMVLAAKAERNGE